jgi:uncharacterized membrane protein
VGLSLLSTAGALGEGGASNILYFAWYVAAAVWAIAILGGIVVLVSPGLADRRETVSGVLAGVAVGVLALATTCFANLNTIRF